MAYKTYTEQLLEHLKILNDNGLAVSELTLDTAKWIRCRSHGDTTGRGEYSYIANTEAFSNGLLGIRTSFRGPSGIGSFKTYGLAPSGNETASVVISTHSVSSNTDEHEAAARKAYGFWMHSEKIGRSDYLERKGVGCYGIRFRSSEQYGNVAVVPMFDEHGKLWSYQLLNPDGTKRHPKGGRTHGLFYLLKPPIAGQQIGIAESYVTAATCMELTGIPVACAFSCHNLPEVASIFRKTYENSKIVIFADNDRHLNRNQGLLMAQEAHKIDREYIGIAKPEFCDSRPFKEASDWNDFVRLFGIGHAKAEIAKSLCNKTMAK